MTRITSLLLPALFLFSFGPLNAQYTDMINTNRPGVSQGAFSVGKNVLQFESGLSYGKEKHELLETETNVFAIDYSVRYGFWREELEVSLIGSFQSDNVTDMRGALPFEYTQRNFRSNTLGAKYLVYDPYRKMEEKGPNLYSWRANNKWQWKDLIPAVSVYAGANFDFADNPFSPEQESTISPKVILSTQNNWIGGFVLVTNIIADRITTDFPSYGYIVTLTHATNDYFSIFVENQGFKSDFYADQLLRGGAAALISENLHVDASVTLNFKDTPSVFYGRIGVAYRFDMHDQDEYIEEKGKKGRDNKRADKGKKSKKKKKNRKRRDNFVEDEGDGGGLQ
ncbi:transporter [Aureitalea sp. L0-47]|uniref:transporter n=1 Tax=Aureitalea sp. L0-47 TaxID=2816962 RepID=UPI00223864D9|nr:transporter [Aureitalea sp. L0-47]MCW5520509.1 transporter [Aureitalea sp. L0-47]